MLFFGCPEICATCCLFNRKWDKFLPFFLPLFRWYISSSSSFFAALCSFNYYYSSKLNSGSLSLYSSSFSLFRSLFLPLYIFMTKQLLTSSSRGSSLLSTIEREAHTTAASGWCRLLAGFSRVSSGLQLFDFSLIQFSCISGARCWGSSRYWRRYCASFRLVSVHLFIRHWMNNVG